LTLPSRVAAVSLAAVALLLPLTYVLLLQANPQPWMAWGYVSLLLAGCAWALAPTSSSRPGLYFLSVLATWAGAVIVSAAVYAILWHALGGSK
jgi:hypothetical protein